MINSSSTNGRATIEKSKQIYMDGEVDTGGFGGFIAKFFVNIRFA
jgi:hypothetical protein